MRVIVSIERSRKSGRTGAKPEGFCRWMFAVLGMQPGDELVDLFPGTGAVTQAYEAWQQEQAA